MCFFDAPPSLVFKAVSRSEAFRQPPAHLRHGRRCLQEHGDVLQRPGNEASKPEWVEPSG